MGLPCWLAAKKKKSGSGAAIGAANGAAAGPQSQTDPPTIPVKQLFTNGIFPEGEWQSYKDE